jgi:hypothetical protein
MEGPQAPPGPARPALRRTILVCTAIPVFALAAWVLSRPPDLAYELELLRADGKPPASPLVFAPGETLTARVQCRSRVHLSIVRVDAAGAVHALAPLRVGDGKAERLGPAWPVGPAGREDFFLLATRSAPPADLEAEALRLAREAFGGGRARDEAAHAVGRALSARANVRWMVVDVREPAPAPSR